MTRTLVRQPSRYAGAAPGVDRHARARDWSEIQERMLVPLYESVHERLDVGPGTRLLGLGCGSGLALLMATTRGAAVTGVDSSSPERLELARERLRPETGGPDAPAAPRVVDGTPADTAGAGTAPYTLVTAFEPVGCPAGDPDGPGQPIEEAAALAERGAAVVLTGWGPPERCAASSVFRVAARPEPLRRGRGPGTAPRDHLEEVARRAGLRPDGSGRVSCPFGYADVGSAVRGLLSTGVFDAAIDAEGPRRVERELAEAVRAYRRPDGTVWMPNVFRYLIARTP